MQFMVDIVLSLQMVITPKDNEISFFRMPGKLAH
jgi:hypothetical protein